MTTDHDQQTRISADPDVPLVRISRAFDAPVASLFRAHVDPELLVQWLGPRRHTMRVDHFDCRTGGSYRYVLASDGNEYEFFGSFHEVRADSLIVQTFTFAGMPDAVALERVRFSALPDGRSMLSGTSLVDSFADRDAFLAGGMEGGVIEGYERLDELLTR